MTKRCNDENELQVEENAAHIAETYLFCDEAQALECIGVLVQSGPSNSTCSSSASTTTKTTTAASQADESLDQLRSILDKYLECPTLLDPSLQVMVDLLAQKARTIFHSTTLVVIAAAATTKCDGSDDLELLKKIKENHVLHILSALYALGKVRGRKTIQRFLPHGVDDVPVILAALKWALRVSNNNTTCGTASCPQYPPLWESIYVLWHWMAVLSLVPFDCHVLVGGCEDESTSSSWLSVLLQTAQNSLNDASPTREAAATCLAAWLARPDVAGYGDEQNHYHHWTVFLKWAEEQVRTYQQSLSAATACRTSNVKNTIYNLLGILQTLTTILKASSMDRIDLVHRLQPIWDALLSLSESLAATNNRHTSLLLQKKLVKWWTRMACAHLPPCIASWRYQRGKRSLQENLSKQQQKQLDSKESDELSMDPGRQQQHQKALYHVPDLVEDAMGRILEALADSSTVVRWSAAKGVGRIAERLPALCAEDTLDAILEYFVDPDKDQCYHGSCLALAELARRGLLLPERLKDVVPFIVRAIQYDVRRGTNSSVGAHVRDAACYTYWAFARAYTPSILRPYWRELSEAIVLTSLFDREVNCRRAASAAFQEAVGRQGATNVPNGIAILTTADYFSLGNRSAAYTTIAWSIAQFDQYRKPIIRHLYTNKLFHWDIQIRTLSSKALHGLVFRDIRYISSVVFPALMEKCLDEKNLHVRHGAVLGVAEITLGLSETNHLSALSPSDLEKLKSLVAKIEKKRLYRGRGGEIMRSAVCRLVECISISQVQLAVKEQVRLLDSVDASIPHPSDKIQNDACTALEQLMVTYFPVGESGPSPRLQARVVDKFVELACTSENPAATRGYSLALGHLPAKLLAPSNSVLDSVLYSLTKISHPTSVVGGESDAETRRNALLSLSRITQVVGMTVDGTAKSYPVVCLTSEHVYQLYQTFLLALKDYKVDRRGDVGSWCRIAALEGLTNLLTMTRSEECLIATVVGAMLKQVSERLDTVRQRAGDCLTRILRHEPRIPGIAGHDALLLLFGLCTGTSTDDSTTCISPKWTNASFVFPKIMQAATIEEYVYLENVVSGLVLSIGGLTETISKAASFALLQWTKEGDKFRRQKLANILLELLKRHRGVHRITLPTLKTLDLLLSHGTFDELAKIDPDFVFSCQELLEQDAANCTNVHRLFAIVDVAVSLLNLTTAPEKSPSLVFVCEMLAHNYPRVRTYTAQRFYLYLLEVGSKKGLDIILNTAWASEPFHEPQLNLIRDLTEILGVRDEVERRLQRRCRILYKVER